MPSVPVSIVPPVAVEGSAGPPVLTTKDGTVSRALWLTDDARAYMEGGQVSERILGSRVGSLTTTRPDRVAGTAYQVSPTRPVRVTAMIDMSVPLGQNASAVLLIGDDETSLVEQDKEAVAYTGLISSVLGITPVLTFQNGRSTKLYGDLSPGQFYKVVLSKSAGASVSLTSVKERVF